MREAAKVKEGGGVKERQRILEKGKKVKANPENRPLNTYKVVSTTRYSHSPLPKFRLPRHPFYLNLDPSHYWRFLNFHKHLSSLNVALSHSSLYHAH